MKARLTALAGLFLITVHAHAAGDPTAEAGRLLEGGNYRAAVERLRPSAPFARDQVQARFLYATALAGVGERDKAIRLFEALVADFPDKPEPYNNLAALYATEGKLDKAKEVLERAMHTNQSYGAVYDNLSSIYVEMARASYVKALRVSEPPRPPDLQLLHAMTGAPAPSPGAVPVAVAAGDAGSPAGSRPEPKAAAKPEPARAPSSPESAAAPAAAARPIPAPAAEDAGPIVATLQAWARAWSDRDVEGYLGFYAADFNPVGQQTRDAWVADRRERLGSALSISVGLEDPQVRLVNPNQAIVTVVQSYASPNYSDRTRKQFTFVKVGERWLIRNEKSLGVVP